MFIDHSFSEEVLEMLTIFKRQSVWFSRRLDQMQTELPKPIARIEDCAGFKVPMPSLKHHAFHEYDEVFDPDGSPKNPHLSPLREFCQIVLELERQVGFQQRQALYDLNGRTENGNDLLKPAAMPHTDGGDPWVRVYLLSDEVAPTKFRHCKTTPFDIYFFSGITRHQAWPAHPQFRDLPDIPRNIAHLRIKGGCSLSLIPIFGK